MQLTRLLYTLAFALGFAAVACGGPDTTTPEDPASLEQEATTEGDTIESSDDALRPRPPAPGSSCSGTGGTCCNKAGSCWTGPSCSISCPSGQNAQCSNGYCSGRVALGGTCGCFGI